MKSSLDQLIIRQETENDFRQSEEITREAFWNLYVPGADEHYILHKMRSHDDFVKELALVAEIDGKIVGNIVYSRSTIVAKEGCGLNNIVTFGPISVHPDYQGRGIGSLLITKSINAATMMGFDAILIYGDPRLYHRYGFRCAEKWDISNSNGNYAIALMALPLKPNIFSDIGSELRFHESQVFSVDPDEVALFDESFERKEKAFKPSQDDFKLLSSITY